MHGEMKERLVSLTAPYGHEVRLDDVRFERDAAFSRDNRGGKRITVLDADRTHGRKR
jgi:hypothetical protein